MTSLEDILVVENDSAFLDFKCPATGYLLWPLIRQEFIQSIISDLVYKSSPLISLDRTFSYSRACTSLFRGLFHNSVNSSAFNADVLLMASGAGLFLRDGKWFNRLSDYFAFAYPKKTLVLEDFFNWHWPYPRHNENVIYHAPIQASIVIKGKLSCNQSHIHQAKDIVSCFRVKAKEILDWDLTDNLAQRFEHRMARKIAEVPIKKQTYEKILKNNNVQLLIKEEGCYGHSSILNRTAKEMGIVVAEYQHGAISAGHDAYNIAQVLIANNEYKKTLPEYFLSYGDWWHDYLRLPVNKVAIGNPHRTSRLSSISLHQNKTNILILGDGVETGVYLDLAIFLSKNLGASWKVIFRPHPLERARLQNVLGNKNLGSVEIDQNLDIYDSFCNAHVVVNEVSTGLFEAVGLADRVLIWDTPKSKFYYPKHSFASFSDADDLLEKIKDGKTGFLDTKSVQSVWAENWEKNYDAFLEQNIDS